MTKSVSLAILVCVIGYSFATYLQNANIVDSSLTGRDALSSLYLFVGQDKFPILITAGLLIFLLFAILPNTFIGILSSPKNLRWLLLLTFMLAMISRVIVHHSFELTLDEYFPTFQAKIFQSGQLLAPLDTQALAVNKNLQPYFTYVNLEHSLWSSYYRPVHAALIANFSKFLHADLLNPAMAVISVWAIANIARRIFPEHPEAPMLAALMLIASPQFLATAGSGFAFPSHLAFNLVWLALFLRGTLSGHITAAAIGFFAIGLHQVHVHPLFVAPFLMAMLLGKFGPRAGLVSYIFSYGLALPIWMAWPEISVWIQTGDTSILPRSILEVDYIKDYLLYNERVEKVEDNLGTLFLATNSLRFLFWVSPAVLVLVIVGISKFKSVGFVPLLAGIGFLLMLLATHVLMPNQMAGWGARYYHPVLGNFILFALGGYFAFIKSGDRGDIKQFTFTLLVASAIVFLPLRALQIEEKIAPRFVVQQKISQIDADVVLLKPDQVWFLTDFVRNDPDLKNRPIISIDGDLDMFAGFGPNRIEIGRSELAEMGLPFGTLYEPGTQP